MPSAHAKHKAPSTDIGIQEKPEKGIKRNISKEYKSKIGKKLPERRGRGFNHHFACNSIEASGLGPKTMKNKRTCSVDEEDLFVPTEIEKEFMKGNRVYYIVLDKGYEKSPKMVTYCRGCKGKISIEDKKFPNNMVFHYRYYRKVPQDKEMKTWAMSKDRKNCYFHAQDMGSLHQIEELANVEIPDVYMDNASFKLLKPENQKILERKHH